LRALPSSRTAAAKRLPASRSRPAARTGRFVAALFMLSFVAPLKRHDPYDIAKDAQQLDHDRVSFDAIRPPLAFAFKRV
jgi:hypothetical protein